MDNSTIGNLLERVAESHEAYEKIAWEIVQIQWEEAHKPDTQKLNTPKSTKEELLQKEASILVELQKHISAAVDAGIDGGILQKIKKETLIHPTPERKETLKSAIVDVFLEDEKRAAASVLRGRVRSNFKKTAEDVLGENKEKNRNKREEFLKKYTKLLTEEDKKDIEKAFLLRMARHGIVPNMGA